MDARASAVADRGEDMVLGSVSARMCAEGGVSEGDFENGCLLLCACVTRAVVSA